VTVAPSPVGLYPHQKEGVLKALRRMQTHKGFYLVHDPGMGKTLSALLVAKVLRARTVAVLAPPVGLGVWRDQITHWLPEAGWSILRRDGGESHAGGDWRPDAPRPRFLITNYEHLVDAKARKGRKQSTGGRTLLRHLLDSKPDLLILDEAQYVKDGTSKRSRAVRELAAVATKVLCLSGTPAHNVLDYHAQYRLIDPEHPVWDRSYTAYKDAVAIKSFVHPGIVGWRPDEVERIHRAIERSTHVATMAELKVPTPIYSPVPIRLTPREQSVYAQMNVNLFAELERERETEAAIILTKLLRLHQITGGFVTATDGQVAKVGTSKLDACLGLLEQREKQRVVIACRFLPELRALERRMAQRGWTVSEITGDTPPQSRSTIELAFQGVAEPMKLLLQYRAGGMSLTLSGADALIIYSMEPSVIALKQMIGRVWRLNTDHAVQILPLLAEGTIDEQLWSGLLAGLDGVDLARHLRRH